MLFIVFVHVCIAFVDVMLAYIEIIYLSVCLCTYDWIASWKSLFLEVG